MIWQVNASLCLTSHRKRAVFTLSSALDCWSGLSDLSADCGGGRSTIMVNDTPVTALQTALQTAKSGREGGKVGMQCGNKPPYFNILY